MYLRKLKALIFLMMSALEWNLERYMVSGERMEAVRQCLCAAIAGLIKVTGTVDIDGKILGKR